MIRLDKKHYDTGIRKAVIEVTLACGCLPYHAIRLLDLNTASVQKMCTKMVKEGLLKKYISEKKARKERIWVMVFSGEQQLKDKVGDSIPKHLMDLYTNISVNDKYRITTNCEYTERLRVLRNAETFMFFYGAKIDTLRGRCESMASDNRNTANIYYTSRELKGTQKDEYGLKADIDASKKLSTTRVNGILVSDGGNYMVYNTNKYIGRFSLSGERKLKAYTDNMLTLKQKEIANGSILLSDKMENFKSILEPPSQLAQQHLQGLEGVYRNIYSLPLDNTGQKMMKIMTKPDWQERIYAMGLTMEQRRNKSELVECDGQDGDTYIFVFCVPNIRRLKMFYKRAKIENNRDKYVVMCFDYQKELLVDVIGRYAKILSTGFEECYEYIMSE